MSGESESLERWAAYHEPALGIHHLVYSRLSSEVGAIKIVS